MLPYARVIYKKNLLNIFSLHSIEEMLLRHIKHTHGIYLNFKFDEAVLQNEDNFALNLIVCPYHEF